MLGALTTLKSLGSTLATRRVLRQILRNTDRQAQAIETIAAELTRWRQEREQADPDMAARRAREAVVSGTARPEGEVENSHAQVGAFEQIAEDLFRRFGRLPSPEEIIEEFDRVQELDNQPRLAEQPPAPPTAAHALIPPPDSGYGRVVWEEEGVVGGEGNPPRSLMDPPDGLSSVASAAGADGEAPHGR